MEDAPFDVDDFMISTEFVEPLTSEDPVVDYFFSAISKWEEEDLETLFTLVTGSYFVPKKGFKEFFKSIGTTSTSFDAAYSMNSDQWNFSHLLFRPQKPIRICFIFHKLNYNSKF